MKFREFDTVRIRNDCEKGLKEGVKKEEIGIIVIAFETPQEAYEVEFADEYGRTSSICSISR